MTIGLGDFSFKYLRYTCGKFLDLCTSGISQDTILGHLVSIKKKYMENVSVGVRLVQTGIFSIFLSLLVCKASIEVSYPGNLKTSRKIRSPTCNRYKRASANVSLSSVLSSVIFERQCRWTFLSR